jgi:hypothetical protein
MAALSLKYARLLALGVRGGADDDSPKPDWKAEARKHERRSKEKDKKLAELEEEKKKRDEENQTEQEKAIEAARKEGEDAARKEGNAEVRTDRLEAAVARLAAGKFADVDDALLRVQAALRRGDLDEGDVFNDESRVQTDVVKTWLDELLVEKKHLASGATTVQGDGDGGKGGGGDGKGLEDMSVDEHFKAISKGAK